MSNSENLVPKQEKLSHKQWRAILKKERRRGKRQTTAKLRDEREALNCEAKENSAEYLRWVLHQQMAESREEVEEERKRMLLHDMWCRRERQAQEWFRLQQTRVEEERRRQELDEQRIREEWEERQKVEAENEEKRKKEADAKKEKQAKMLKEATLNEKTGEEAWHNPIAPPRLERIRDVCPFFIKVAACRFGDRCSRVHPDPETTNTLLLPGMFQNFKLEQSMRDEYDTDLGLEIDDSEVQNHFVEFYEDVLPEFRSIGRVIQFKVCCNQEPHLRGNVYVQYTSAEEACEAMVKFNSRWYGGRQISCRFVQIDKWANAICGLHFTKTCPKGSKACNFLHVFRNPDNEFRHADRDRSPRHRRSPRRHGSPRHHRSERDRSSRGQRSQRESDKYRVRGHGSVRYNRSRSRSPSRRRSKSPRRNMSRSPSHTRSRSQGRKRSRSPSPNKSWSRSSPQRHRRSKSPSRQRSRSPSYRKSRPSRKKSRSRSRSRSRDRKSKSTKRAPKRNWDRHSRSPECNTSRHRPYGSRSRSRSMSPFFKKLYQSGSGAVSSKNNGGDVLGAFGPGIDPQSQQHPNTSGDVRPQLNDVSGVRPQDLDVMQNVGVCLTDFNGGDRSYPGATTEGSSPPREASSLHPDQGLVLSTNPTDAESQPSNMADAHSIQSERILEGTANVIDTRMVNELSNHCGYDNGLVNQRGFGNETINWRDSGNGLANQRASDGDSPNERSPSPGDANVTGIHRNKMGIEISVLGAPSSYSTTRTHKHKKKKKHKKSEYRSKSRSRSQSPSHNRKHKKHKKQKHRLAAENRDGPSTDPWGADTVDAIPVPP